MNILQALAAPFPPADVSWRAATLSKDGTKGMAVCYIDARDVQDRLDEVMGSDWVDEIVVQPSGLVTCRIGLWIEEQWRWRMDGTAAVREVDGKLDHKQEQAREMDQKGAVSDAFKRAAVKWGIGRYLYTIQSPWVAVNQYRQIEPAELPRLAGLLERHARGVTQQAPRLQPQPRAERPEPPPADEPGVDEPAPSDISPALMEARADPQWKRIEALLERNPRTRGDVTRIVEANRATIDKWPEHWKAEMRIIVTEAYARVAPEAERQAA